MENKSNAEFINSIPQRQTSTVVVADIYKQKKRSTVKRINGKVSVRNQALFMEWDVAYLHLSMYPKMNFICRKMTKKHDLKLYYHHFVRMNSLLFQQR